MNGILDENYRQCVPHMTHTGLDWKCLETLLQERPLQPRCIVIHSTVDLKKRRVSSRQGPHGWGKTNAVHAIAKQTGCPVLELNTRTERGAHRLKATMEEATQKDSLFDLMRRRELFLNRVTQSRWIRWHGGDGVRCADHPD